MAGLLDFLNPAMLQNGQAGGLLGNMPTMQPQAPQGEPDWRTGINNFFASNPNMLMALGGGLASGGIGAGLQAGAQAGQQDQKQRLALAHLLQQQSQFGQELALKKHLTSPEYLGLTEEQKAQIAQKYQNPIALPPGGSLYKPGAPGQEGSIVAQNSTGLLSDDAVDRLAHQVSAGDMTPLQQQGYGPIGAVNRSKINERVSTIRADKGISGEEAATKRIEYGAENAAARATANREVAVQTPAAEFKRMAPIAIEASEALDRTNYPNINALTNAVQKGVGGENVVRAHTALTSVGNIYARVISPTGQSTDATRSTAYGLLNEALAKGQVRATMELMGREIAAAETGVKDVQAERLRNFLQKQGINVPPGPAGAPKSGSMLGNGETITGGGVAAPSSAAPAAIPPPIQREVGKTYQTPKGPMIWRGHGWEPEKDANSL